MNNETDRPENTFCGRTRREFLWEAGAAFTSVSLVGMLTADGFLAHQTVAADGATSFENPLRPRPPHFAPNAKSVLFLFMFGGPGTGDSFLLKPKIYDLDASKVHLPA